MNFISSIEIVLVNSIQDLKKPFIEDSTKTQRKLFNLKKKTKSNQD